VKISRFGQATPLCPLTYQKISSHLETDIHKLFWGIAWYTGERPETILRMEVVHAYSNPVERISRDSILYPACDRKDKATREVPVHKALKLILSAHQPLAKGFLFPSYKDGHLTRQAVDKAFRRALKKAEMENQGYSLYSPRRGFIIHLKNLGYDIKIIQRLTGCRNLNSFLFLEYADTSPKQLKNVIDNF
jgi:integrase/recombinase XerD